LSFQHLLLLVLFPLALGVLVCRQRFRIQIGSVALAAALHAVLLLTLEVIPQGGFSAHNNTWQGYAVIELGPFLAVLVALAALHRLRPQTAQVAVAALVPATYWLGLLIAVVIAVSTGLATP